MWAESGGWGGARSEVVVGSMKSEKRDWGLEVDEEDVSSRA